MFEKLSRGPESPTLGISRTQRCVYLERLNTRLPVALGEEHSCRVHLHQRRAEDGPNRRRQFLARRDEFVPFSLVGVTDGKLLFYF